MNKIKQSLSENLINIQGWRTKRKIVVIESDDWGSVRMPSKEVFNILLKANIRVDKCPFCSYDSLASEDDLTNLFEILRSFSDKNGNHPVITANCVVANPDFLRISDSGFSEYHYELFTDTLKKYAKHNNSFSLWKEGIKEGLFYPQLHGREHLNVTRWMNALRKGSSETLLAFRNKMFGISSVISSEKRKSYLAAFDADNEEEFKFHEIIIEEAISLFKMLFNYSPHTFIFPNYTWSSGLEKKLLSHDIKIIQGSRVQMTPDFISGYYKKIPHYLGQKNRLGQIYTMRNCLFEPSFFQKVDWLSDCLRQIRRAFHWNKPAIIGSHRLNFIGYIVEKNRTNNLKILTDLMKRILKEWPEVEFMNSHQLGELIYSND